VAGRRGDRRKPGNNGEETRADGSVPERRAGSKATLERKLRRPREEARAIATAKRPAGKGKARAAAASEPTDATGAAERARIERDARATRS